MEQFDKKLIYATLFILIGVVAVGMLVMMIVSSSYEILFVPLIMITISIYSAFNKWSIDLPWLKINVDEQKENKDE